MDLWLLIWPLCELSALLDGWAVNEWTYQALTEKVLIKDTKNLGWPAYAVMHSAQTDGNSYSTKFNSCFGSVPQGQQRLIHHDSLAVFVSVSVVPVFPLLCCTMASFYWHKETLWTTTENLLVFLMQPMLCSDQLSRSGNSRCEVHVRRTIFICKLRW